MENVDILIKALKAGFVKYPLNCPDDCFEYRVECLYYNQNMKRFYIYVADGIGELFAEDYRKEWEIVE